MHPDRKLQLLVTVLSLALQAITASTEAKPPSKPAKPPVVETPEEEPEGCYEPELSTNIKLAFPRWWQQNFKTMIEAGVKTFQANSHDYVYGYLVFATSKKRVAAECVPMPDEVTKINRNFDSDVQKIGCLGQVSLNGANSYYLPKDAQAQWMRLAPQLLAMSDLDFAGYEKDIPAAMEDPDFLKVLMSARFELVLWDSITREWTKAARDLKCSQIKDSVLTVSPDGKFTLTPAPPKKEVKRK